MIDAAGRDKRENLEDQPRNPVEILQLLLVPVKLIQLLMVPVQLLEGLLYKYWVDHSMHK